MLAIIIVTQVSSYSFYFVTSMRHISIPTSLPVPLNTGSTADIFQRVVVVQVLQTGFYSLLQQVLEDSAV